MNIAITPEKNHVSSAEELMSIAQKNTGLNNWGDLRFLEPLGIFIDSANNSANLTVTGIELVNRNLLRLLSNRLKFVTDLESTPEIMQSTLPRPYFIFGLPRTGTTLLQRLMSQDSSARYLKLWEGMHPSPPPGLTNSEDEKRIQLAREWAKGVNSIAPDMEKAHPLNAEAPEECFLLFEHTFIDSIFELRTNVPEYSRYLVDHEADISIHQEYKRLLQLLSYRSNAQHWILKAPRHIFGLKGLISVFPDSKFIQLHRNPVESIASLCKLCEIDRKIFSNTIDKEEIGHYFLERLAKGIDQSMELRSNKAINERFIDIHYRQLLENPIQTIKEIYQDEGFHYTNTFEQGMLDWINTNPQNKHGKHRYSLEEYGLTKEAVANLFSQYISTYDL